MRRKTTILMIAFALAAPSLGVSAPTKPKPHPAEDVGPADLFHGYRCGGGDCALHQQGYQWGAEHKVVNPSDCRGTSEEFIEGCRAYAGIDGPLGVREIFQDED
ncbi:MAG TPA: hypothetical protein VN723_03690 [Rhizomicrobium sp.]|jgi:hypothetical protein|nr:hypothetical protein [Rhizomicrobium sp.]